MENGHFRSYSVFLLNLSEPSACLLFCVLRKLLLRLLLPFAPALMPWAVASACARVLGAKRVLFEVGKASLATTGAFINCEDGLQIPW